MLPYIFVDDAEFNRLARLFNDGTTLFKKALVSALRRTVRNLRSNLGRKMRGVSYLKGHELTGAIGRVEMSQGGMEAAV